MKIEDQVNLIIVFYKEINQRKKKKEKNIAKS
jgi:hypothetical protein